MSAVNVTNVTVLDNPSMFLNPFQFEISYECLVPLKDDLEWKLIYVGSAEDEKYDQVLESVLVGPVNVGNYRFVFQADPPELAKIPEEDIIGVTVLLLTCSYQGQEFIRVGYYVSNDYVDETLREEPPIKVIIEKVQRNILADKPRVTKFPIVFDESAPPVMTRIEPEDVALPPSMHTDQAYASSSVPHDSMVTDASCVPTSPPTVSMQTDDESSVPSSPAAEQMVTDDTTSEDLHTPQVFELMPSSDGVRQGELHASQALQEVC